MKCANCGHPIEFDRTTCRLCSEPVGYPNVRKAEAMRADLDHNFANAVADAERRGVKPLVDKLEALLSLSVATINLHPNVLLSMTLGTDYRSYYKALDAGLRTVAEEIYHRHRNVVDAAIHSGYYQEITYAAVSPDRRGLTSYGEITLQLGERFIAHRATVLRENAFAFYERYDLGRRDAREAPGWRCVWSDRGHLGIAHLEIELTLAVSEAMLPNVILAVGVDKDHDKFMEGGHIRRCGDRDGRAGFS